MANQGYAELNILRGIILVRIQYIPPGSILNSRQRGLMFKEAEIWTVGLDAASSTLVLGKWADKLFHLPTENPAPGRTEIEKRRDGSFRTEMNTKLGKRKIGKEALRGQLGPWQNIFIKFRKLHTFPK
jgi:hypothetical protein